MALTRILALVNGTEESRHALKAALNVGQAGPSLVDALHVELDMQHLRWAAAPGLGDPLPGSIVEEAQRTADERAKQARAMFDEETKNLKQINNGTLLDPEGQSVRFMLRRGHEGDELARAGRTHDLTVVPRPQGSSRETEMVAVEAALFESGHPVLIVPEGAGEAIGSHIAIAWTDTKEAARALWASRRFLEKAKRVTVIMIVDADDVPETHDINEVFLHKGIDVEIDMVRDTREPIAEQILKRATDVGADLLCMGAYGHSRMRQLILGGATRGVLWDAEIPVLMAH